MLVSTSTHTAAAARLAELSLPRGVQVGWTPEPIRRLSSGVPPIDALLGGGIPRGRLSELCGPFSSGKTSLLLAILTAVTRRGEVAACVDIADALHPASVAAAGADLQHVLWVRPRDVRDGLRCTELLLQAGGLAVVVLDLGAAVPRPLRAHVWPRLRRAAEQSHTACLILAPHRVAGSCAVLGLHLRTRQPRWRDGLWPLFEGFDTVAIMTRSKLGAPGGRAGLMVRQSIVESRPWRAESERIAENHRRPTRDGHTARAR